MYTTKLDNNIEAVEGGRISPVQAARRWSEKGYFVIPIPPRQKRPVIDGWQNLRLKPEDLDRYFGDGECNIGLLLSEPYGVGDVDLDCQEALDLWELFAVDTTCVFGHHPSKPRSHWLYHLDPPGPSLIFKDPTDNTALLELRCQAADGGVGRQTVIPPSTHAEGEPIRFERGLDGDPANVQYDVLAHAVKKTAAACLLSRHYPARGSRHETEMALGGVLARAGWDPEDAKQFVRGVYGATREPDRAAFGRVARSVEDSYRKFAEGGDVTGIPTLMRLIDKKVVDRVLEWLNIGSHKVRDPNAPYDPLADYPMTDIGNSQRFVDKFHDQVRYCPEDQDWYAWDGIRWRRDRADHVHQLAKTLYDDLMQCAKADGDKRRFRFATRSAGVERIRAAVKLASTDPGIHALKDQFNAHDHLINCPNGVVDLRAGELLPHDRNLLLNQLCPTDYVPDACHQEWTNVVIAVTRKHPELAEFLQLFVGYCAGGNKGEELIALFHGPGGTGKGTFFNAIQKTLGADYVRTVSAESLLRQQRGGGAASGDIARLEGSRLAIVSEFAQGSKLQENFLKMLSGNDTIVARGLYREEREFAPKFQLIFQSNKRPRFDSTDTGNRRRYVEVPFDNVIAEDPLSTVDPNLKKRIAEDPDILRAVLSWIVTGAVDYRTKGLVIPECVKAATKELFRANDMLAEFFADCLIVDPGATTPVSTVRNSYKAHCGGNDSEPLTGQAFNRMLEERGLRRGVARSAAGRSTKMWFGVRLAAEVALGPEEET